MGRPVRKFTIPEFVDSLPHVQKADELREIIRRVVRAHQRKRPVIFAMGAHVIKCGLQPVIRDLIENGIVTALAMNGAGVIHDFEIAYGGATSEWVEDGIKDGTFGVTMETGRILNDIARRCIGSSTGLGKAFADHIHAADYPHKKYSLLAAARAASIPVTVHVAIGCDVIHMHPNASGAAIGEGSLRDFHIIAQEIQKLDGGGIFFNIGSSVIMPEIFLKAVSLARNRGVTLADMTSVNMDFITHYRPMENVLLRPHLDKGNSFNIIGHHEIMLPLLAAGIKASLMSTRQKYRKPEADQ